MPSAKWILPLVIASGTLAAQNVGDLNSLSGAAARYVSHGMGGTRDRMTTELCKINGDNGGDKNFLMSRATDVVHWTFLYSIKPTLTQTAEGGPAALPELSPEGLAEGALPPHHSLTVQSMRGVFGSFKYSPSKVADSKSLEFTWIAVPLGDAIQRLNGLGYVRGFSTVTLMRPADPKLPDEYVYIFDCPWERSRVALSTQSGDLVWLANY